MSMHASFGAEAILLRDAFVSRLRTLTEVLINMQFLLTLLTLLTLYNTGCASIKGPGLDSPFLCPVSVNHQSVNN